MKLKKVLPWILFPLAFNLYAQGPKASQTQNFLKYEEKKIQYQYKEQIDKIKKINKNKLDLIRGKYPEFIHNDESSSILNSHSAIHYFINRNYQQSLNKLELVLKTNPDSFHLICGLYIINKLLLNQMKKLLEEYERCEGLNKDNNQFSMIFLKSLVEKKINIISEKKDKFYYEYGQSFDNVSEIKAYLKLALIFNEEEKIRSSVPNLPPGAYEDKEIRELLSLLFFRVGEIEKTKKFLTNINTVNSSNLLGTLLLREEKYDLAFARFLLAYKKDPYIESTLNRLLATSIKTGKHENGLQFINKKLNFTNSLNNEISQRDSKLLEIYFLIKNKKYQKAAKVLKNEITLAKGNPPAILLTLNSFLSIVNKQSEKRTRPLLIESCKRNTVLSCYLLQVMTYFPDLNFIIEELNYSYEKGFNEVERLKQEITFSPLKERVIIDQKYIEELDSL